VGAVTFSIDPYLLETLCATGRFDLLVETGTYLGDTVELARGRVPEVVSIERNPGLATAAIERFQDCGDVTIIAGESAEELGRLRPSLTGRPVLFWLDAHWCAAPDDPTNRAGGEDACPLLAELRALSPLGPDSVVLIDDARLFLAPPPSPHNPAGWPTMAQVLAALASISAVHVPIVVNDVIIFHPTALHAIIANFAAEHGAEWLSVADKARAYDEVLADNVAKELVIDMLRLSLSEQAQLPVARSSRPAQGARLPKHALRVVRGRGNAVLVRPFRLFQYDPRPLSLPLTASTRVGGRLPSITVIMPTLNQSPYIEQSIRSVVDQGYPSLEFAIQDGGSTDGTESVLERYRDRVARVRSEADDGQADAISRGFAGTSGEIMGWLNSDDLLLPGALDTIGTYFSRHPEVDVIYGSRIVIDEAGFEIGRWTLPHDTHRYLDWADYIPQETLYWRRSLWDTVGARLDTSYHFALDWELLLRFVDAGATFARLPQYLGAFRVHAASKTVGQIDDLGTAEMDRLRGHRHGRRVPSSLVNSELRGLYLATWKERSQRRLRPNS
jgi:hypothetical protein